MNSQSVGSTEMATTVLASHNVARASVDSQSMTSAELAMIVMTSHFMDRTVLGRTDVASQRMRSTAVDRTSLTGTQMASTDVAIHFLTMGGTASTTQNTASTGATRTQLASRDADSPRQGRV